MTKPKKKDNDTEIPVNLDDVPVEVLMNYYRHQYERMAKLEDQRTAITNITITLSVLAFTFGFNTATGFAKVIGFGLLAVMMLANIFAIAYILRTRFWIKTHGQRAKGILEARFKALREFDKENYAEYHPRVPSRWQTQMYLHITLLIVAIVIAVYLWII